MHAAALRDDGLVQQRPQIVGQRITKGDVRHDSAAEKGVLIAAARAVKELVRQHDVTRPILLLQAADGGDGDDPAHVQAAQRPDVGPVIQLRRQDAVAFAMTRQEVNPAPGQRTRHQRVRRRAEGRRHGDFFAILKAFEVVEAGAANDADGRG